jgi:CDP-diacylglycerol---glycerol-3-phosphate 3-phosphatidyltransferase
MKANNNGMTLTDRLRDLFCGTLERICAFLFKLGIRANQLTALGIIGNLVAAYFICRGDLRTGGWIVLLTGPLDALDGTLARMQTNLKPFGALFDSVADRISEAAVLFGLLYYFLSRQELLGCILVFFSLTGSFLVSYIRARAQSLGSDPKIGILTRVERFIVISLSLLFVQPIIGLWILAVLTHVTVMQRIWFAWKELQ